MDFTSAQNKFFMIHQESLEDLVHCATPKNAQQAAVFRLALSKKLFALLLHFQW